MGVITKEQKHAVENTRKDMEANLQAIGEAYFLKIFQKRPDLIEKFPTLKGRRIDAESAVKDKKIKQHAEEVYRTVYNAAVNLADSNKPKINQEIAEKMAKAHVKYNVAEIDFPVYGETLTTAAKEQLKKKFTPDLGKALKEAHEKVMDQAKSDIAHANLMKEMKATIEELKKGRIK